MILRLTDGSTLRVQARESPGVSAVPGATGSWEILRGREWIALPPTSVASARLERDVLAEARKLERSLAGGDRAHEVAHCAWLVDQGLKVEALERLDRILQLDADQTQALDLLARSDLDVALPKLPEGPADSASLAKYFAGAAQGGPAVRELAIRTLRERLARQGEAGAPALREELKKHAVDSTPRRRAFAILALRRLFPGHEVRTLVERAVLDASEDVRLGASLALRDVSDAAVALPCIRALGSKNSAVRTNAAQALGNMSYKASVEPLITHLARLQSGSTSGRPPHANIFVGSQLAYIQDFDVEVAQNSTIADPVINVLTQGVVLDVGVIGASEYVIQTERATVRRSLAQLTGARPGNTTQAWLAWWKEHGDEWKSANVPQGSPSSPTSPEK
jgi:hypothetical protein